MSNRKTIIKKDVDKVSTEEQKNTLHIEILNKMSLVNSLLILGYNALTQDRRYNDANSDIMPFVDEKFKEAFEQEYMTSFESNLTDAVGTIFDIFQKLGIGIEQVNKFFSMRSRYGNILNARRDEGSVEKL